MFSNCECVEICDGKMSKISHLPPPDVFLQAPKCTKTHFRQGLHPQTPLRELTMLQNPLVGWGRDTTKFLATPMYDATIKSTRLRSNTNTISRNMWIQETRLLKTETQPIKLRVLTDKE